jgi:DNA-binding NtrC family response regulator
VTRYDWPGNIRQLRNARERAAILCEGGLNGTEHLSRRRDVAPPARSTEPANVERRTIEQVLREAEGNKSEASRRLGITRTQLYGRMRKYAPETNSSRGGDERVAGAIRRRLLTTHRPDLTGP